MSLPYDLLPRSGPALGLIVLRADETLETDMRRMFDPLRCALHVSRVSCAPVLTPEAIAEMARDLTAAAALLPPAARFDAIGYGCTSGTAQIGAARVAALIRAGARAAAVTNPLSAALAALAHLGLRRVGLVSPYTADVAAPLTRGLEAAGVQVTRSLSFGEADEAKVTRIDPRAIAEAARQVAKDTEAVFLSCTNLRTLDIIAPLEADLGVPVLSSNQVLGWDMARHAGLTCDAGFGRLMAQPAA